MHSEMKISTRGRYALRIMLDIAVNGGDGPVSFRDVSQRQGISVKYMEQIGSILTRAGFLRSVRGAQGGYYLVGKPSVITVGDILRVTEGQFHLTPCTEADSACDRTPDCMTYPLWNELNRAILNVVDNTTLQDLIDENARRRIITVDGSDYDI